MGYEAGGLRDITRAMPLPSDAAVYLSEGFPGGRDRGGFDLVWHSSLKTRCRGQYPKGDGDGRETARLNEHSRDEQCHCHSESGRA
jgi:hypothetical protein